MNSDIAYDLFGNFINGIILFPAEYYLNRLFFRRCLQVFFNGVFCIIFACYDVSVYVRIVFPEVNVAIKNLKSGIGVLQNLISVIAFHIFKSKGFVG